MAFAPLASTTPRFGSPMSSSTGSMELSCRRPNQVETVWINTEAGVKPVTTGPLPLITELRAEHWPEVARIYAEGIATANATFETEVPSWERWNSAHLPAYRFIAMSEGKLLGWVAASPFSSRCGYAGVVEESVYVAEDARGHGVGKALIRRLVQSTEAGGVWTLQTGIFPENEASLRLHQCVGFRVVGCRERLGRLNGVWRDVLLLERRSREVS